MKVVVTSILCLLFFFCSGQISFLEIEEESDFCTESNITYVHVYTDWCGLCKLMKQSVYPEVTVQNYLTKNFHTTQWNPEKHLEEISKKWNVRQYPTFLFLDEMGNMIYRYSGVLEAEEFLKVLKTVNFISKQEITDVEKINSFDKKDAYGLRIIAKDQIQKTLSKEKLDSQDVTNLIDGINSVDNSLFFEITKRLQRTPLNFKQKQKVKTAIIKYYSQSLQLEPSEEEMEELTIYISSLSSKIRPKEFSK